MAEDSLLRMCSYLLPNKKISDAFKFGFLLIPAFSIHSESSLFPTLRRNILRCVSCKAAINRFCSIELMDGNNLFIYFKVQKQKILNDLFY